MEKSFDLKEFQEFWQEVCLDSVDVVGFALSVLLLARAFEAGELDRSNLIRSLLTVSCLLYDEADRLRFGIEKINPVVSRFISGDNSVSVGDLT